MDNSRTRRNIIRMGAIAATAVAARVSMTNAHANQGAHNGWGGVKAEAVATEASVC
jgi:hypothetical protein